MLKRVISILLAVAMLPLGSLVFAAQNEAAEGNKAGWFIDAETSADTFVSDEEAIGKKAVEGEFSVEFSVPEEKLYYLYARVKMETSPSSISYAFDTDGATISAISGEIGEFVWVKVSTSKVLSKGDHEVSLVPGSGVLVDGIVVSELETLPLSSSVTSSKAAWAEEQALPSVYPDIFEENMINEDVHFEKGDRVLFFGDSITQSVGHTFQYHTWVLTYYSTRYPDCEFTYINAGRSGDTTVEALKRLVSDVHIHDYNKIVVMLGTNDVNRVVWEPHRDDPAACDEVVFNFIRNLDTLLKNFSDKEIILMGPTCWNEFSDKAAVSASIVKDYNSEIRRVNNILRDYAYDNSIPYIDLNTALTKTMLYYTRKDSDFASLYGSGDRTHPSEYGHYIMGYNLLRAQGATSLVAGVNIDVSKEESSAENATVSNVNIGKEEVSYTYLPKSLPIPADKYYREVEKLIPLTDNLNREIIKVSGLGEGNYTVKLNGETVLENIPYTDLEEGINISTLQLNPNQQKALEVKGLINERSVIERNKIRVFRASEYEAINKTSNGLTKTMSYDELIEQASKKSNLATYVKEKKALYNYFGAVDFYEQLIYTINKPEAVEVVIERSGDYDESSSVKHSYTLENVPLNEGSPEIRFFPEDTLSKDSDFIIEDGVLTSYTGSAKNVYIPQSVTSIKEGAFSESGAEFVYVPGTVKTFEAGAFKNLAGADVTFSKTGFIKETSYNIKDEVAYTENSLLYYNPTNERDFYEVQYGTKTIEKYAFANAENLESILIYDTVTEIGENAFSGTDLVIKCNENSAAHQYAVANSIDFELVPYSTNTNLEKVSYNGTELVEIIPGKTEYEVRLFAPLAQVNLSAVAEEGDLGATLEVLNSGKAAPCEITVRVTAQDRTTVTDYVFNFTLNDVITDFTAYGTATYDIKHARLDGYVGVYSGYDGTGNFPLTSDNTSAIFGHGVVIQRPKGDAGSATYKRPFYSNKGDPLLGAEDGRYWYSFKISEPAIVYVAVMEGKEWTTGLKNGWRKDDEGLKFYGITGAQLYKKHFGAGTVNIPAFGTHSSYEASPDTRVEMNPSVYGIIFDSSIATSADKNKEFAIKKALWGEKALDANEAAAPILSYDVAAKTPVVVTGTAKADEEINWRIVNLNNASDVLASGKTEASKLGLFSFEVLGGEKITDGATYKIEMENSAGEKISYYFKTAEISHNVVVTPSPEIGRHIMGKYVKETDFFYADNRLGEREVYTSSMIIHRTEMLDGVVTAVKKDGAYVMDTVTRHEVGVKFSSERPLHRVGLVGNALKGLNHIVVNQNTSPERMSSAISSLSNLTFDGESITAKELYNKYTKFFSGNNVFYSFVPDAAGTAYVMLPYENKYFETQGWTHLVMGTDDVPEGYSEWGVVPESTYFSTKYPYQLAKFQHDAGKTSVYFYKHVYYRSFEKDEKVDIYTGGANYYTYAAELPKTAIRWGEHVSTDTSFELTYGTEKANITENCTVSSEKESFELSGVSKTGGTVVLDKTKVDSLPATITATVTAKAGNTKTYEITIEKKLVSTKIKEVTYKIDGISTEFTVPNFDGSSGNEFSIKLPHEDVRAKIAKTISSVTAGIKLVDDEGSFTISPADGVLDFSQNGRADLKVVVTDREGKKETFVIHFSVPVYNVTSVGMATLKKVYGKDQVSAYDGFSAGEPSGNPTSTSAGSINANKFSKETFVLARAKAESASVTKKAPFYGGATYTSDESGWWLTFNVTDDSYVYVWDREGKGWPNRDKSYWTFDAAISTDVPIYRHYAKAGELVKIANYGYDPSWDVDPNNPQRVLRDPSYYIIMPVSEVKTSKVSISSVGEGTITAFADEKTYADVTTLTMDFVQGTEITLTAEDNGNFLYWIEDSSKKILSYEEEYTFALGSGRNITAVYKEEAEEGVYLVTFKNANDIILTTGYNSSDIYAPENPYISGYEFDGWYIKGQKTEIEAGDNVFSYGFTKDTVIVAGYTKNDEEYDIYFENVSETEVYKTVLYNTKVTLRAPAPVGEEVFVYWMRDGQIVSYEETYTFYSGLSDTRVRAVYSSSAEEKMPVITMSEPVSLSGKGMLSFMAERNVPEDCILLENGILLGKVTGITVSNFEHKVVSSSSELSGQLAVRKKDLNVGDTWYARAYLIYQKDGVVYTVYSDEVSGTYTE